MMTPIDTLLWINLGVLLLYVPFLCYLDIRYREVHPAMWIPLVVVCLPVMVYMYGTIQFYPFTSLGVSAVMSLIFYVSFRQGYFEGADYLYLIWISWFWVMTPVSGYAHGLMQFAFMIYLVFTLLVTAMIVYLYNLKEGNDMPLAEMISSYPRGVPMMLPICAAFILSVVFG